MIQKRHPYKKDHITKMAPNINGISQNGIPQLTAPITVCRAHKVSNQPQPHHLFPPSPLIKSNLSFSSLPVYYYWFSEVLPALANEDGPPTIRHRSVIVT